MGLSEVFAPIENKYKNEIMKATWGHLAPKKNKKYKGRVVYTAGCFGSDPHNGLVIFCDFDDLCSSPWFYDCLYEMVQNQDFEAGIVYQFDGYFKNYKFYGNIKIVFDSNQC